MRRAWESTFEPLITYSFIILSNLLFENESVKITIKDFKSKLLEHFFFHVRWTTVFVAHQKDKVFSATNSLINRLQTDNFLAEDRISGKKSYKIGFLN